MIALEATEQAALQTVVVVDAGPDPRSTSGDATGATYSGMDARHVSLTETAPWTSGSRIDLIRAAAVDGGWNCLRLDDLRDTEQLWLDEFCKAALSPDDHVRNTQSVVELNRQGVAAWRALAERLPGLFTPIDSSWILPIVIRDQANFDSEFAFELSLDPTVTSNADRTMPSTLEALPPLSSGTIYGAFTVAGTAYYVKALCARLVDELERRGVIFRWREAITIGSAADVASRAFQSPCEFGDALVWAAGVSLGRNGFLQDRGVVVQGVAGCWREIANPGFERPFKVLGDEPVNFINCTPAGDRLLLSGGYGFVGERPLAEARSLVEPIHEAFDREIAWWFFRGNVDAVRYNPSAVCVRPSLPVGMPTLRVIETEPVLAIVCVGHAAGGFTQSPVVARRTLEMVQQP